MENFKISVEVIDNEVHCTINGKVTFEDLLQTLFSVMVSSAHGIVKDAPEEHKPIAKSALYDHMNLAASKALEIFAPEFELRPNLTALAIKEAEDKIILEGRLNEVEAGS